MRLNPCKVRLNIKRNIPAGGMVQMGELGSGGQSGGWAGGIEMNIPARGV